MIIKWFLKLLCPIAICFWLILTNSELLDSERGKGREGEAAKKSEGARGSECWEEFFKESCWAENFLFNLRSLSTWNKRLIYTFLRFT